VRGRGAAERLEHAGVRHRGVETSEDAPGSATPNVRASLVICGMI